MIPTNDYEPSRYFTGYFGWMRSERPKRDHVWLYYPELTPLSSYYIMALNLSDDKNPHLTIYEGPESGHPIAVYRVPDTALVDLDHAKAWALAMWRMG